MADCPALLITAPASGQGKTTVVAALARLHTRLGRRVRVFKCGPDFLDPQIHAIASGAPCRVCSRASAATTVVLPWPEAGAATRKAGQDSFGAMITTPAPAWL